MSTETLPKHWASLGRLWQSDITKGFFVSPIPHKDNDEYLIAERIMCDGWISCKIKFPVEGARDAGFVFRYQGEAEGYLAGVGGWDSMYFIAQMIPDGEWKLLAKSGKGEDARGRKNFLLRVEFVGSTISLFEGGVQQLSVNNKEYYSGRVGLYGSRTQVRFSDVRVSPRKCFVVMPFKDSLAPVYSQIQSAAAAKGLECVRADENRKSRPIMEDVISQIKDADLVIVDLTDQNANVYYEAGFTHALNKNYVLIAESTDHLTFDVRHMGVKIYGSRQDRESLDGLKVELEKWIDNALSH